MLKFFRKIRQNLLSENKTGKYFKYAIGEIALVMIGILLALQVNNWNEKGKARKVEINYLKNIQADLFAELKNNNEMISERSRKASFAHQLLNGSSGKTKAEQLDLIIRQHYVLGWRNFIPTNNTYKELISSGQLNSISNDSIKYYLLELDKTYASIANSEHHMRREFEQYLYNSLIPNTNIFDNVDFSKSVEAKNMSYADSSQISDEKFQKMLADFNWLKNNQAYQNGLKLALLNNLFINDFHKKLTTDINKLNSFISEEIKLN